MRGFSLEATRPSRTMSPLWPTSRPPARASMSARCRRGPRRRPSKPRRDCSQAGFEPVPHLAVRNFATAADARRFPRPHERRGRRAARAGDRRRPRAARRRLPQLARGDRRRRAAAPRHRRDRHRRLSRRPSAHVAAGPRPRARGQDPRRGDDRDGGPHRHPVLLRGARDRSNGSRACATSASSSRCASGLPARPISRRSCATPGAAACGLPLRAWPGRPAWCGSCSRCRRPTRWCARWPRRAPTASRRDRAAFLLLRRTRRDGALGAGGGGTPDRARRRRGLPGRAAAPTEMRRARHVRATAEGSLNVAAYLSKPEPIAIGRSSGSRDGSSFGWLDEHSGATEPTSIRDRGRRCGRRRSSSRAGRRQRPGTL